MKETEQRRGDFLPATVSPQSISHLEQGAQA